MANKHVELSKAERRLKVKEEKNLKRLEKQARQLEATKSVIQAEYPKISKTPIVGVVSDVRDQLMEWARDMEDRVGRWSWNVDRDWGEDVWNGVIHPHLCEYAKKLWKQIYAERTDGRQRHVYYDVSVICAEAFNRLRELKYDDQTRIFRFRLQGLVRLYGFVFGHKFKTVWYDPTHDIYPVEIQDRDKVRKKQARERGASARERA